ncbi:nitroreductase family protein [Chloroflexota bacterium]
MQDNVIIPASRWYSAIKTRRSRRQYDGQAISPEVWAQLCKVCAEFQPFPGARAVPIEDSPVDLYKGIVGSYGKIVSAPSFIAFIGDMDSPNVQEEIGYTGEGIILEAESLKLNTCWMGAFYRRDVAASFVEMKSSERIVAISAVGYAVGIKSFGERLITGFGWTHRRKSLSSIADGLHESEWSKPVKDALEAAKIAPSATNRQPWIFTVTPDSITVSVNRPGMEFNVAKRLDCGIAMLHLEVSLLKHGISGKWEFLKAPEVARFNFTG